MIAASAVSCSVDEIKEGIQGSFPYLEVEVAAKNITKVADSDAIAIQTNRKLNVSVLQNGSPWLTANVVDDQLVLDWKANDLETTRTATITLSTPNRLVTREIVVTQDASGELTVYGDLVLRSKDAIAENTYTKTTGDLIIGDVVTIATKATSNDESTSVGNKVVTASPSNIDDSDLEVLKNQIHQIGGQSIVVLNTNAKSFPLDMIKANNVVNLYFDYNKMEELPSASVMESLGLTELSVKGNLLTDVSVLADCSTIKFLDLSENEIYDLEPLIGMTNLQSVVLTDLPLTQPQIEVFREQAGLNVVAESLRQEDSPLPLFGAIEVVELGENLVEVSVEITENASDITNAGFYVGTSRKLDEMTFVPVTCSGNTLTMRYEPETLIGKIYYVRAYAENGTGGNYSKSGFFGSRFLEGDLTLNSDNALQTLVDSSYSHINGSVFIGKTTKDPDSGTIRLNDGNYSMLFRPAEFNDLSAVNQLVYIRDGLYIGNIGLDNLDLVSHISGIQTMWLRGNNIKTIPMMESEETLKSLDVAMNALTDFSFLDRMPALETLYLGSTDYASRETNEIGMLNGLEKYTNLKYINLGGLPVHEWQVEDLRVLMPDTKIDFVSGGRVPYIPTVKVGKLNRTETTITLSASVTSKGKADIIEYGFYYGKDLSSMTKEKVGENIEEGTNFTYTITVPDMDTYLYYPYAINYYGESRTEPSEYSLNYLDLSQGGTANCYLIQAPGRYKFNAAVRGNSTQSVGKPVSTEVVWQFMDPTYQEQIISSVELVDGYVQFEVADHVTYGNALIAVKDKNDKILWSWHIWVCDFDPETTAQKYKSGAVLMDRNLGATLSTFSSKEQKLRASGTMYQWGRKDPMMYIALLGYRNWYTNVEDTFAEPNVITNNWTWLDNGQGVRGLWSPNKKTVYDPCPPGWKVADNNSWDGVQVTSYNEYGSVVRYGEGSETTNYPFAPYFDSNFNYYESNYETHIWGSDMSSNGEVWYPYSQDFSYDSVGYGSRCNSDALSVRCMKDPGFVVTTSEVVPYSTTAKFSGNLQSESGAPVSECGFVWSTDENGVTLSNGYAKTVVAGSSSGNFTAIGENLNPSTTYYVRAYAKSSYGVRYGDIIRFVTGRAGTGGDDFTEDEYEW